MTKLLSCHCEDEVLMVLRLVHSWPLVFQESGVALTLPCRSCVESRGRDAGAVGAPTCTELFVTSA